MKYLTTLALVGMGMYGLQQGVQYSGWVLFIGCCVALSVRYE
jgi:hypothetical protein